MNNEEKLLTPREAAKKLMVSPITLRQWAQKGFLPAFTTLGGHRRFKLSDIEKFLNSNNSKREKSNQKLKILIIDDDLHILKLLSNALSDLMQNNVLIETTYNGFDGGVKVHTFNPDVLLLDVRMNGMDGYQVCKQVKQNKLTSHIRILTMTGFPSDESTQKLKDLGAEACFAKPLDFKEIIAQINESADLT